jgi:V8-like Glu-specific endopeptidase
MDDTVELVDEDGDMYCAGVWVARDAFLTAGHCVDDVGMPAPEKTRRALLDEDDPPPAPWDPVGQTVGFKLQGDPGGKAFREGVIERYAGERELALVRVTTKIQHGVPELRSAPMMVGEVVHVVGHPMMKLWSYSHGYVSKVNVPFLSKQGLWLQLDVGITNGNSGGGAFDDKGQLIGIAVFAARSGSFAWFVPQDAIRVFLAP